MSQIYTLALMGLGLLVVAAFMATTYYLLRKAMRLPAGRALLAPVGILMAAGAVKLWGVMPLASGVLGPIAVAAIIAALSPVPWTPVTLLGIGSGLILPMVIAGVAFWPDVWTSVLAWILAAFFALQTAIEIKRARERARERQAREHDFQRFRG